VVKARLTAEQLVARFTRLGYSRAEPPVLQPAEVFLDLSGEDIRRRMFVTTDAEGRELALRPEFTIPIARLYLASADAGHKAAYSYCGPVFRLRPGESGEFVQAGIESFGRADQAAADAEIIALGLDAVEAAGDITPDVRLGDVGLFTALTSALDLPAPVLRRLTSAFAQGKLSPATLPGVLAIEALGREHAGLLTTLSGQDPRAARAFVEDLLKIAGISSVGGRSAGEIAERFLAQAEGVEGTVGTEVQHILSRYLAISGDPDSVAAELRDLTEQAGIDLDATLDEFETRSGFLAARGIEIETIRFSTSFGRNLDYYTGMVFEIRDVNTENGKPLVGGGRYDRLVATLAAGKGLSVPAVGCSIWMDRLMGDAA
jgi:ATP phosphoribosyltransferase regulatory subunit